MESDDIVECFKNSVYFNKLRYTAYIGDGDTKSYTNVLLANPYPGFEIEKAECVGHVQDRVDTRLRKFKIDCKEIIPICENMEKQKRNDYVFDA